MIQSIKYTNIDNKFEWLKRVNHFFVYNLDRFTIYKP